jgi:glyoxylase-like metal-dependent hydrolase (beta-lactamase superfamily II)
LHRVRLENTAFDLEGASNAYVLTAGDRTVLVDAGVATERSRRALQAGARAAERRLEGVDAVFLTHWHPDHAGLAGFVQSRSDAPVYVHEADAPLVSGDPNRDRELSESHAEAFRQWDIPDDKREEMIELLASSPEESSPEESSSGGTPAGSPEDELDVESFRDGATFEIGDLRIEAIHAPGHTAGLSAFAVDRGDRREVLTGDALLPVYTPNVGGADVRVDRPLTSYLESLDRLRRESFDRALPGHRDPIDDPASRIDDVVAHHRDRANELHGLLRRNGSESVWEVATDLFGPLDGFDILLGVGEAHAHLEYLEDHGVVERTGEGYRPVGGERAVRDLFSQTA